jgi:lipopolysaccharide biosynthesis glycosyltransferase
MKRGLLRPASPKTTVRLVDTSKMLMGLSLKLLPHTSLAAMDRILLPALLPDVSKVIYLDGDTVVPGDLSALYRQGTSSKGIAAKSSILPDYRTLGKLVRIWARDPSRVLSEVRIDTAASCFNSGVMLLDLDILRAHQFVDIALELAAKYGLNDQLIFNIYATGDYARLDASWNVFVGQDAPPTKNIIHWVGPRKPWSVPGVPLAEFWHRYCR